MIAQVLSAMLSLMPVGDGHDPFLDSSVVVGKVGKITIIADYYIGRPKIVTLRYLDSSVYIDNIKSPKVECDSGGQYRMVMKDTNWLMQTTVFHGTYMTPESTMAYRDSVRDASSRECKLLNNLIALYGLVGGSIAGWLLRTLIYMKQGR